MTRFCAIFARSRHHSSPATTGNVCVFVAITVPKDIHTQSRKYTEQAQKIRRRIGYCPIKWRSLIWNILKHIKIWIWREIYSVWWGATWSGLTHWGRYKMAAISQMTLSNAFSWIKMLEFRLDFHWSFIQFQSNNPVQVTISQHWFR